ncbi:hypothetical protein [uncultured Desulfovibrio sp.]|uniref:hypothetical protein n=1 Tax=uncultured Desulfovibrio sp. TaxID=167968 RepID=UPI0026327129|nr:hypothetical protein [uncultured Desulfovibrio sp.]
MTLLCRVNLPWCQADIRLEAPPGTDKEGLLALLREQVGDAEVFVFFNGKMLLSGQTVPESGEVLILPVLSGG